MLAHVDCEHPDCEAPASLVVSSALGDVAVCEDHVDSVSETDEHGRTRFAKWYRVAVLG